LAVRRPCGRNKELIEKGMRIDTVAQPKDLEPAADWVSGLIGAALDKRVAAFKAQERSNPLLVTHFRGTFGLEFALAEARKYRRSTGRLPKGDEYAHVYGFLVAAHRIHGALSPADRNLDNHLILNQDHMRPTDSD
jgi:hypothetical protein